jgi:hypothetical protein
LAVSGDTTERIIRASEVGRYTFCARAWWLGAVQGLPSAHWREMAAGQTAHLRHGRRVRASVTLRWLAYLLLALAALVGALVLVRVL